LNTIYRLVMKDVARFFNDKRAMILTFILPMVLIVIFGNIFGDDGSPRGKVNMILVNESNSVVAKLIEEKLDTSKSLNLIKVYSPENGGKKIKIDEQKAVELIKSGRSSAAALVMPKDFFTDTSTSLKFKFYYDPKNDIESAMTQGIVQKTIMTQVPRIFPILMRRQAAKYLGGDSSKQFVQNLGNVFHKYFKVDTDSFTKSLIQVDSAALYSSSADTSRETNFMGNLVKFDDKQLVGKEILNPGLTRTVGGWAIMFLLFSITGAATSFFEEKQEGTLKRLLCMPVTRAQILWGKYIYTMLLGIIQLLVLFIFSWMIFKVDVFSNFGNLLIVIIASAAAAVSFAMLIISLATSINQASGISTLLILVMSALGGSWFPISFLPNWMQTFSKATLTYWSVEAFLQVLWRQAAFGAVALNVFTLLLIAVSINFYAIVRFKNGRIL